MRIYLTAIVIALASVATIISVCLFHESSTRIVPTNIAPFN
ncbi:MAG: hypothetical protein JWQ21_2834 [Herminiimonas sp.]|jgi:multisubunit Na+/H+ antiporter MnhC subunit|nr:hypothetical protein [Herminiimonas sp.]